MDATPTAVEICYCYAQEDEVWRQKIETHLSVLKRQGLVSLWHHRLIVPGTDWAHTIDTHLETASIILLLVSADFFASDYCYGIEMQHALKRHEAGEARVIPLLVRPVDWKDVPFAHLHVLPTDARPLSIWQDEDTALTNVAADIRRVLEDLPLLAASAPRAALPAIWNIPYPRNPFFLGRVSELAQVRQRLQAGQTMALSQPQAISGLGGIGKTQVALEYAYQYHHDYTAVLWARADNIDALTFSYVAIASLLQLPEYETRKQEVIVHAVKSWLQTHCDWLLILDNADELALLSAFLPSTLGGHLLLTTRAAATGRLAHRLEIEILLPEQGAVFLLRRSGLIAPDSLWEQASPRERELALQISQELGGLPLALDQAGAYLEETGVDLAGYWHLYQQYRAALLQQRGGLVADHPEPVATTWSLSFQRVEERNPAAAELLRLCAYLAPDSIPEEILTAGASLLGPVLAPVAADAFQCNQAIEVLRAYSLIRRNPTGKTLSIHRLVQVVLQDTLKETERRTWGERAMLAVNAAFPHVEYDTWLQCERLLTQALLVTQWIEQYQVIGEKAGSLLYETASYLYGRARYTEAELLDQRVLRMREQQLGSEHPLVASLLNNLANLYEEQGKYAEAELLYQRALCIWEQELGLEHPAVATSLNGLASLYYQQGKYVQAELLYQRALRIREQELGSEHPLVASLLNNLANLYKEQGKCAEAELLYQRALCIWEQELGLEHPAVATVLNNLALLYADQGKYAKAELLYQRALYIREKQLGLEHPDVAMSLNGLANLYYWQDKYAEAESHYQRALLIREKKLGPEHPIAVMSLNGLANLYTDQGKYVEAELLYQRAMGIRERQLGPEHPVVAASLGDLANLYADQGKYAEAEPLYRRALYIWEQQLGREHPEVAYPLNNLASLYYQQSKYAEALPLYQRIMHIRECILGSQHHETIATRKRLITLLHALGQHEQAEHLERDQAEQ